MSLDEGGMKGANSSFNDWDTLFGLRQDLMYQYEQ